MRFAGGTLMPVFRRRSEPIPVQTPEVAKPGGKGRPTPKRSDAEKRRRQLITAPKDRKEAYRKVRERQAEDRAKVREGMARGEDKYLQKRDRGPVRRLARDYVDARRTAGSYLMWSFLVIFAVSLLPFTLAKIIVPFMFPLLLGIALVEGLIISQRIKKVAAERFPGENLSGVGMYAAMRSMQMRRLRLPKPRLQPGDKDKV
jgi:hypothetical protein